MPLKVFISIAIIIATVVILVNLFHNYCDDVYELFAFSKTDVVQVDKNTYRCSKDEYKNFITYMENDGWKYIDQMGSVTILEKRGKRIWCDLTIKKFYSEWSISEE